MKVPLEKMLSFVTLNDDSDGSTIFRSLLKDAEWIDLMEIAQEAMKAKGNQAAFALQDCVNTMGRRLGFDVDFGRYRGTKQVLGYDGLWKSASGRHFVVEVKKSGAYSVDPGTVSGYLDKLNKEGKVGTDAVGIYVHGSGESKILEDSIRGAGLTRRIRVLTLEGLVRLVELYQDTGLSHAQIVSLLSPIDSVRVDDFLNIIKEVLEKHEASEEDSDEVERRPYSSTDSKVISQVYSYVTAHLEAQTGKKTNPISQKFRDWEGGRAVLYFSKEYEGDRFWFALHPKQVEFLQGKPKSYAVFACGKGEKSIVWPFEDLREKVASLNVTQSESRRFWHIQIFSKTEGTATHWYAIGKGGVRMGLDPFVNNWKGVAPRM